MSNRRLTVPVPEELHSFLVEEQDLLSKKGTKVSIASLIVAILKVYRNEARFIRAAKGWLIGKLNFPILAQTASEEIYEKQKKG
jgi:hypothetical protein